MPIFEYRCTRCRTVYELLHLGREKKEEIICPSCGAREYTKLFSALSVQSAGVSERGCEGDGSGECCGGGCRMQPDSWK